MQASPATAASSTVTATASPASNKYRPFSVRLVREKAASHWPPSGGQSAVTYEVHPRYFVNGEGEGVVYFGKRTITIKKHGGVAGQSVAGCG